LACRQLTIRGKGSTVERLPLPHDVGEAFVAYLRDGRPVTELRLAFLPVRAPIRRLSSMATYATRKSTGARSDSSPGRGPVGEGVG
jgi:hypothetical protein